MGKKNKPSRWKICSATTLPKGDNLHIVDTDASIVQFQNNKELLEYVLTTLECAVGNIRKKQSHILAYRDAVKSTEEADCKLYDHKASVYLYKQILKTRMDVSVQVQAGNYTVRVTAHRLRGVV